MRNAPISYDAGMAPIRSAGGVSGGIGSIVYAEVMPSDGTYFQCNGQVIAYPQKLPFQPTSYLPTIGKKTNLPLATTGASSHPSGLAGVWAATYDGSQFWISQSDGLYVTPDLVTFSKVTGMTNTGSSDPRTGAVSLAYDGVRLIAGLYPAWTTAPASVAGAWQERGTIYSTGQPGSYWESIAVSGDGRYMIVGQTQKIASGYGASNPGTHLFQANGDGSYSFNGVCWDGARFIIAAHDPNQAPYLWFWDSASTSSAATNTVNLAMNQAPLNLGNDPIRNIAYGAGRYMAITSNGKVLVCTSDPKVIANWSVASTLTAYSYRPGAMLAYGAGLFVLVGNSGQVRYSSDGASWVTVTPFDSNHLLFVVFQNGKWLLGGPGGLYELFLTASTYTLPSLPVQVSRSNVVLKPYLRVA